MNSIEELVSKYYEDNEKESIYNIINEYNFKIPLNSVIGHLHQNGTNNIGVVSSVLLSNLNKQIVLINNEIEKQKVEKILSSLCHKLLVDLLATSENPLETISTIEAALSTTCEMNYYNYEALKEMIGLDTLVLHIKSFKPDIPEFKPLPQKKGYLWTQKGNLNLLATRLKVMECITDENKFVELFNEPITNDRMILKWNEQKKTHLAYLLRQLIYEGYIRILGTKGYFTYAQQYIVTFDNKPFGSNSLKKISSMINDNKEKYNQVIAEIDSLLVEISKIKT